MPFICGDIGNRNLRQSDCKSNPLVPQLTPIKKKIPKLLCSEGKVSLAEIRYTIPLYVGSMPHAKFVDMVFLFFITCMYANFVPKVTLYKEYDNMSVKTHIGILIVVVLIDV